MSLTDTIDVRKGDVHLAITIEDAQALRAAATILGDPGQLSSIATGDRERLQVLAPYLTLTIEQAIRRGASDASVDDILPASDTDAAYLSDPNVWVVPSREGHVR